MRLLLCVNIFLTLCIIALLFKKPKENGLTYMIFGQYTGLIRFAFSLLIIILLWSSIL